MSQITQVLPAKGPEEQFDSAQQQLLQLLVDKGVDPTLYGASFNPYPLLVPREEIDLQRRLQRLLQRAIWAIVTNFFADKRLAEFYSLPDAAVNLIQSIGGLDYHIGSYRPDILYDTAGGIKICEINARFPANAYFITQHMRNIAADLTYLKDAGKRGRAPLDGPDAMAPLDGAAAIYPLDGPDETAPLDGMNDRLPLDKLDARAPFLLRFPKGCRVRIIKKSEPGTDVHLLLKELTEAGHDCRIFDPLELPEETTNLARLNDHAPFFLELHQHEIIADENRGTIEQLAKRQQFLNDLRTIFIVHDKRFLALLSQEEITRDYLGRDDAAWLKDHIVPTYSIKGCRPLVIEALRAPSQWVLKPNLLGKAEGVLLGKTAGEELWRNALRHNFYSDYVLQRYVQQKTFTAVDKDSDGISRKPVNLVGTMLCFDDLYLGPGIVRAAREDPTGIVGGGSIFGSLIMPLE